MSDLEHMRDEVWGELAKARSKAFAGRVAELHIATAQAVATLAVAAAIQNLADAVAARPMTGTRDDPSE